MPLTSGSRLGPYDVVAQIGVGGMGEVYRATDTNLARQVAIKVLPEAVAQDAERLARFDREAKTLAALNHPNIAQIYGLEKSDGQVALVMELVEGPTLADRIAQGPMPIDEALAIAKQIAEALEAAHEQGIIHRDLKPANIKVRDDGTVKVLDFGLAKAVEPAGGASGTVSASMSPTITTPAMTEMGMILGTAAYMSPEQAKGRPVDKRSDIWAFGAVLYEMLTGRRAFAGEDVSDTMASVLKADTDWAAFPAAVPATVVAVIQRCLQRDRDHRARDIGDVRLALDGAFEGVIPSAGAGSPAPRPLRWWPLVVGAAVILAGAVALVAVWPSAPGRHETQWRTFPAGPDPAQLTGATVSPDGRSIVLTAGRQLWLWPLNAVEARLLPRTEGAGDRVSWSPDSRSLAFAANGELRRIDLAGGPPQTIAAGAADATPGAWNASDVILFRDAAGGFSRVQARGGEVTPVVRPGPTSNHLDLPAFLPDGVHFLYLDHTASGERTPGIYVASIEAGPDAQPTVPVLAADDGPVLVQDTTWDNPLVLFWRDGDLLAQAFDPDTLTPVGGQVRVADGVGGGLGVGAFSASATGDVLLYRPGGAEAGRELVWVDADGGEEPLAVEPRMYIGSRLSPDGEHLTLFDVGDVFVWDLVRQVSTNVTANEADDWWGVWTRDGTRVIFTSDRDGPTHLYWQAADGTGLAEPLTEGEDPAVQQFPTAVSPDGEWLVYIAIAGGDADLRLVSLTGEHTTQDLLSTDANEANADVSPNGRWVAYQSDRSGRSEIYVSPFPTARSSRVTISSGGGTRPAWAADGRTLFYISGGELMAAEVDTDGESFVPGPTRSVLDVGEYFFGNQGRTYEVVGNRFVFVRSDTTQRAEAASGQLHVVLNGFDGLLARLPTE